MNTMNGVKNTNDKKTTNVVEHLFKFTQRSSSSSSSSTITTTATTSIPPSSSLSNSRPSTFLKAAGIASFGPNDTFKNPNWKTISDHRDVRLIQRHGQWVKVPWVRQDSFADVYSSGLRPSTPDSIQIKGSFQQRENGFLTKAKRDVHDGELQLLQAAPLLTASRSSSNRSSSTEVQEICDSVDRILGEWKYVLQNDNNDKKYNNKNVNRKKNYDNNNNTKMRKSMLSRAQSVPVLSPMTYTSNNNKNKNFILPSFRDDKAMSEINKKDLEDLSLEFVDNNYTNTNGKRKSFNKNKKRELYLAKVAQIGKRAGLTPKYLRKRRGRGGGRQRQ